MNTLHRAVG